MTLHKHFLGLTLTAALMVLPDLAGATAGSGNAVQAGPTARAPQVTVEVQAMEYRFVPNRIEVKKGTVVTVRLLNIGTEKHEWELEAYDKEIHPIAPRTTGSVTFVANKAGTFEFVCDLDGHRERGMRGEFVVK